LLALILTLVTALDAVHPEFVSALISTSSAHAMEAPRPLRVVTFNMFHGGPASGWFGDGQALEERLRVVTDELRALAPDVIALQEASVGRERGDVARRLAVALGMEHVHATATTRVFSLPLVNQLIVRLLNFAEGPAVLSRFPITGSEVYDLPRCAKRLDPRVLVRATVRTPWGEVAAFSAHVSRDDCQLSRVAEIARAHAALRPTVLMGDFNTGEAAPAIRALDGFVDVFRAVNPGRRGSTGWQRPWAPARTAQRRIDYIFVAGVPDRDVTCDSRVVLDQPRRQPDGRTLWPSDHYGVLADVRVFGIKCAP
jgi:endonuclease/exonuclease/phosphatase family metal-dependent hydrolase